jgi:hypothetical protein
LKPPTCSYDCGACRIVDREPSAPRHHVVGERSLSPQQRKSERKSDIDAMGQSTNNQH